MTSLERVLVTLGFKEPDRVPLFLLLTMHGAKELGLSIKEYYLNAEYVIEGQKRLYSKYKDDCLYSFTYASLETEAWGGETFFSDDGPPNGGEPIIRRLNDIAQLKVPAIGESPSLLRALEITRGLYKLSKGEIPVIGVVMSPFSLPVIQMGFESYLKLLMEHSDLFWNLIEKNIEFTVKWANAQLDSGATAIAYFDPISSTTIIPRDLYMETGYIIAKNTISRIKGPTATHLASGRGVPIYSDLAETGTVIAGVTSLEDLSSIKKACYEKLTVLGNMNGIEMSRWTQNEAEKNTKEAILKGAPGGGFILSDTHGEIPFQVSDDILLTISETVHRYGQYPLAKM